MDQRKVPSILSGKYFKIDSVDSSGKVLANCIACGPSKKPLSGSIVATSNFVKHLKVVQHKQILSSKYVLQFTKFYFSIQRIHENLFKEYQKDEAELPVKKGRQSVLPFPVLQTVSKVQTKCHKGVLRFIVNTMSPLSFTENPHFRQLLKGS